MQCQPKSLHVHPPKQGGQSLCALRTHTSELHSIICGLALHHRLYIKLHS